MPTTARSAKRAAAIQEVLLEIELAEPSSALSALLEAAPACRLLSANEAAAKVSYSGDAASRAALLRQLLEAGLSVSGFAARRMDLQDVYLARSRAGPVEDAAP